MASRTSNAGTFRHCPVYDLSAPASGRVPIRLAQEGDGMEETPAWFYGKAIDYHELVMWAGETSLAASWLPLGLLLGEGQGERPSLPYARPLSEPLCHGWQRRHLGEPGV